MYTYIINMYMFMFMYMYHMLSRQAHRHIGSPSQVLVCPVSAPEATLSLAFTLTPKAQFDQAGVSWYPIVF